MNEFIKYIKKVKFSFSPDYFKETDFFTWLRCAYLSLKYVDEFNIFPCIQIKGNIDLKINKHKNSTLIIKKRLIIESWLNFETPALINIGENAKLLCENDFTIGNNVNFFLSPGALLLLKGRVKESGSGITANAVIMVKEIVEIGEDCIIAWDTYITDCDWHSIEQKNYVKETIIGNHNWIGVGAKILKGVKTNENCIITSNSVVLAKEYESNSLISGNPATIIKSNINNWCRDMKKW